MNEKELVLKLQDYMENAIAQMREVPLSVELQKGIEKAKKHKHGCYKECRCHYKDGQLVSRTISLYKKKKKHKKYRVCDWVFTYKDGQLVDKKTVIVEEKKHERYRVCRCYNKDGEIDKRYHVYRYYHKDGELVYKKVYKIANKR